MNGGPKDTKKHALEGNNSSVIAPKRRKLCSMGTGEIVHIISYKALPGKCEDFEERVQEIGKSRFSPSNCRTV